VWHFRPFFFIKKIFRSAELLLRNVSVLINIIIFKTAAFSDCLPGTAGRRRALRCFPVADIPVAILVNMIEMVFIAGKFVYRESAVTVFVEPTRFISVASFE
jgi:hypothetical protein